MRAGACKARTARCTYGLDSCLGPGADVPSKAGAGTPLPFGGAAHPGLCASAAFLLCPLVFHSACGVPPENKENYGVGRATFLSGNRREIHCLAFFQGHPQFLARGPVPPPLESEMLPLGTSRAVHWLGLCACPAGSMGLSSGRGMRTPHASQHSQNK